MNEDDLKELKETLDAKAEMDIGLNDLARSLRVFREALQHEGFNNMESLMLTTTYLATLFQGAKP